MRRLIVIGILLCSVQPMANAERWVCTRWYWVGDVFNRTVYCLQWIDKDAPKEKDKKK